MTLYQTDSDYYLDSLSGDMSARSGVGGREGEVTIPVDTESQENMLDSGGLELLLPLDEVYVRKESNEGSRYTLLSGNGETIFTALMYHEDECLGQNRSFVMSVARLSADAAEPTQVFDIRRKRACESIALRLMSSSMYGNSVSMNWTSGRSLGQISQLRHCCRPTFEAENASGRKILRIQGGWGGASCNPFWACNVSEFDIFSSCTAAEPSGIIKKNLKPFNFVSERVMFGANFPADLDPLSKLLIIGALFQLNVTYFERKFSGIDMCIIFRYLVLVSIVLGIFIAAKLGIIQEILFGNNKPELANKQIL